MEAGKKERNLLGKVLSAEDTMKVKSSLWLLERDVGKENSVLSRSSPLSSKAVIPLQKLFWG